MAADDVAKAIHFLFTKGDSGSTYNLADPNETDQGKLHKLLEGIYGIKTDFVGAIKMTAASALGTKFLVGFANDEHLKPFSDACKKYGIFDTPLTPYLDEELVLPNPLSVDGSAITQLGFKYDGKLSTSFATCTEFVSCCPDGGEPPRRTRGLRR